MRDNLLFVVSLWPPALFPTLASFRFRLPKRFVWPWWRVGHALDHFIAAARGFLVAMFFVG